MRKRGAWQGFSEVFYRSCSIILTAVLSLVLLTVGAIAEYNVDAKPFAWTYTGDPLRVM